MNVPCLCHGTTTTAFESIARSSLKPESQLDLPWGRSASRTAGRAVLMLSPFPHTHDARGGFRKKSEVYVYLGRDKVANFMRTSERKMYMSHRAAIMSCDAWPWQCIDAAVVPGNRPGYTDKLVFTGGPDLGPSLWKSLARHLMPTIFACEAVSNMRSCCSRMWTIVNLPSVAHVVGPQYAKECWSASPARESSCSLCPHG